MLTSFLEKSRPVNILIMVLFLSLGYFYKIIPLFNPLENLSLFLYQSAFVFLWIFILLLINFIINKNHLTQPNTLTLFFFCCFTWMFPTVFTHNSEVIASFFLLLACRRIFSLDKDTNAPKKILDAGVWITIASLFYFWSLLFLIPLWLMIIQKPNTDYKQMLMPLVGFSAVLMITIAFFLIKNDLSGWFENWRQPVGRDFSVYNQKNLLIPATILLGIFIWTGSSKLFRMNQIPLQERPKQRLLLIISGISILVSLAAPVKSGVELIFTFPSIAMIAGGYFGKEQEKISADRDKLEFWFKETLLWVILAAAVYFLLFG